MEPLFGTVVLGLKKLRIKETVGYKKRFHSAFMRDKPFTLTGQLIKETMDKRNSFLTAL